ncbi:MAG: nucleoside triphosphate pyrophosphohydrolase [Deltaproteobacteria bacterium]|nr:nucleoside triphosphate pyrophosphohydrolase [Deltaproteobacteria bacterium]
MDKEALSRSLFALIDLLSRLRGPNGCPWDALQTDSTIRMYVLEEAYEVVDAVERGCPDDVCQELGDLFFQILFLADLGEERGEFDFVDVVERITEKMKGRHPHVFGTVVVNNAEEVAENWQEIKKREKGSPGTSFSLLQGLPADLPALLKAHRLNERALQADLDGFVDKNAWSGVETRFAKLKKAVSSEDKKQIGIEMGNLLFDMANLARDWGLNAENLLRESNQRFIERFNEAEKALVKGDMTKE